MAHTLVDICAGCGGLTMGFHLAGFVPLCAIDHNLKALKTYQYNHPTAITIAQDIRQINSAELREILKLKREQLTALVSGLPCQGFSRNIPADHRYLNDPRNQLYRTFITFVQEFMPLYVVIENVPEIINAYGGYVRDEIVNELERRGYKVVYGSLNAVGYGVPQNRVRAFFIASLNHQPELPQPTYFQESKLNSCSQSIDQLNFYEKPLSTFVTVKDAIGDLPPLEAGQKWEIEGYPSLPQSEYQEMLRHGSLRLVNHIARPLSRIQLDRVRALLEGEDAHSLPSSLAPKKHYSGAYGRLWWNAPAKTLTQWLFHPGSGRFFHPSQNRTITIREAARLHSYSDTFHFLGTFSEMSSQIGESVPPLLAKAIATNLLAKSEKG